MQQVQETAAGLYERMRERLAAVVPEGVTKWMKKVEALPYSEKTTPPHWKSA